MPAWPRTVVICVRLAAAMARRSSTPRIGPLNRVAPPSVLTATSRGCAWAIPWTAAVATNVPRTVVAIFLRATRTTLTLMLCLLALSGDRAELVQERDHRARSS